MKITILGANGQTGVELTKQALVAGHQVIGVVRKNGSNSADTNLSYVEGDATDAATVERAAAGADVIISTLGGMNPNLMTSAVEATLTAAKTTGVKRVIWMSSFLAKEDYLDAPTKLMATGMAPIVGDKKRSEEVLRNSGLDWTIIYPTILGNEADTAGIKVVAAGEKLSVANKINRAAVAAFILGELPEPKHSRSDVVITQK